MRSDIRYFQKISSLRFGKAILVCQLIMVIAGIYVFLKIVPWLLSSDISEIGKYESPMPPPPSWAQAYSVDHGTFRYFRESPTDSPFRVAALVALLLVPTAGTMALSYWALRQSPKDAGGRPSENEAKESNPYREELMRFIAMSLETERNKLSAETRFQDDLRVPPGEMEVLMEEIGDHFGISIEPIGVRTIGDLFSQICPDSD